jgi:septal ring factor EnvC (AmiA/AmiB activator)
MLQSEKRMTARKNRPFTLFVLLCLALGLQLASLSRHPQQGSQTDVSEYEKRLNTLATEIETLQAAIQREKKRESSVLARLGRLGLEKKLILNQIDMFDTQRERTQREIEGLKAEIPRMEASLEKEREAIERILVTLYKFGRYNYFELMLQADSIGTLLSENRNLVLLAEEQEQIINDYLTRLEEINTARERLESKRIESGQLLQKAREKQGELETQEKRSRALITEIDQDIKTHEQAVAEKIERAQQLQDLIKQLLDDKIDLPFPLTPLDERKGRLPWPVTPRRVVTRFGVVRHPKYNTTTQNNGIEIAPQNSMLVKAVHQGIVRYADYHNGYGFLIIIDHGMDFYTVYAHCSEFYAKQGQAVQEGDPIARVGDIGSLQGTTLYFEIRRAAEALDPLQWLRRR